MCVHTSWNELAIAYKQHLLIRDSFQQQGMDLYPIDYRQRVFDFEHLCVDPGAVLVLQDHIGHMAVGILVKSLATS